MKNFNLIIAAIVFLTISCSSRMEDKNRELNFAMNPKSSSADDVSKSSGIAEKEEASENMPPPPPPVSGADEKNQPSKKHNTENISGQIKNIKKIIKEAQVSFEVDKYKNVKTEINKTIEKYNAYLGRENEENNEYKISNTIDIRVPNEKFDILLEELVRLSKKLDYKRINAKDITEEYYDTKSRLESKKRVEQTYLDLLKKAGSIGDILQIQEKIGQIQEEIEAKEGSLKLMDDKVTYSTITLYYYELHDYKYIPEKSPGFFERLAKALNSGWEGLVAFILILFYLWPLWLIVGLGLFLLKKYLRRRKNKKQGNS